MGILRTDKISGLEKPTAVTGSVNFPGSDDYITAPANTPELLLGDADFTIEGWFYKTNTGQQDAFGLYNTASNRRSYLLTVSDSATIFYYNYTGSSGTNVTHSSTLPLNKWAHVAITRDGTTLKIYVDGKLSGTTTGLTSGAYANTNDQFMIGSSDYSNANGSEWTGHISNLRIVKGYVLYDGDFTVPDHALEVVPGTVLLACNNPDSVTAVESALVGKGLTLTAVNDVAVTSVTPGLTRDFTSGTEFKGVTTFDTQGYFVPPSGTTEQRGRGRGFFVGGNNPTYFSNIDTVQISSQGNAIRFGDLSVARAQTYGAANSTRGIVFGSYDGSSNGNFLEAFDTTTGANAIDFGNLLSSTARRGVLGMASNTRAIAAGGATPSRDNTIQYVTIASLGDAQEFGDLIADSSHASAATACSPTRGVMGGGTKLVSGSTNSIGYITMATTGNSVDFGDANTSNTSPSGVVSSSTRGVFLHATSTASEFITISTLGNAQTFGDIGVGSNGSAAVTNSVRGINAGGFVSPANVNTITFVNIASTGEGTDFGDLIRIISSVGGYSDSHGGVS